MAAANNLRRLAWLSLVLSAGAGVLYWTLAPAGPGTARDESSKGRLSDARTAGPKGLDVGRLLAGSQQSLIDAYGSLARDQSANSTRKLVLSKLFSEDNLPQRLSSVLAAVANDPTPPEHDPLWPYLVEKLSNEWQGETLSRGLDLMFAESRERPKQALVSSFAALANSARIDDLTAPQRQTLTNYFIDMYRQLPGMQRAEVDPALRKLANNDVADVLLGKGVSAGGELEGERAYKAALVEAQRALAKGPEAFNPVTPAHGRPHAGSEE